MARPAKSVDTMSKNLTKEEYENRKQAEEKLKGGNDKIKPPTYLSASQKKIFKYIVDELKASNILCNLDIYILTNCSIAIDRIQEAEKILNADILNKDALKLKESYTKDLFRYTNELSLSPQSRAKLANINVNAQAEKEDPLLKAMRGNSNGD
jgi:P27 family predicted phage terminase small subunit